MQRVWKLLVTLLLVSGLTLGLAALVAAQGPGGGVTPMSCSVSSIAPPCIK